MINFQKYKNATEIRIPSEITLSTANFYNIFSNMTNLKTIIFPKDKITDMNNMCRNCTNLTDKPVCGSNVTNMSYTYYNCTNLTGSPICGDNVTNMYFTYYDCEKLTGSPICGSKVTDMFGTYSGCSSLTGSPVCGNNVTGTLGYTYRRCSNLTGQPVCSPNVTSMYQTYMGCSNLTGSPICGNRITDIAETYRGCYKLTGSPVCGPNVINMSFTYANCYNLTGSPVCGNNVQYMNGTYENCYNLTGSPVCGNNVQYMNNTYYNCTNLTGSPVCSENVTNMAYAYYNCTNLTGQSICSENVTNMAYAYYNCTNLTKAIIGQKVTDVESTYHNCSSLSELTILAPYVKYHNTLTNVNFNLQISTPEESLGQYIESEWGSHGIFMSKNRNIYLFSPYAKELLLFNEVRPYSLKFKKLNSSSSVISEVSVTSEDETIITISNIVVNEDSISFNMHSLEKEGISTITITYSDKIQTYTSTFKVYVLENIPEFTYSVEPIDGINYTFVLDENGEYYQNNTVNEIADCAICKIKINANGIKKLYIDYNSDFYPNNYGYISDLDKTLELSNTQDETYLKKVGWNKESGSIDYGIVPFGEHEIYIKYYKGFEYEWGTGLFRFKIRIEDVDAS